MLEFKLKTSNSLVIESDGGDEYGGDSVTINASTHGFDMEIPLDIREMEELHHLLGYQIKEISEQRRLLGQP